MNKKVERLIVQYPFLARIIPAEIVGIPTDVRVKVERADTSHMFWKAEDVDGVNQFISRGKGHDHRGTRSQHVYLVDRLDAWRVRRDDLPIIDILEERPSNPDRWSAIVIASNESWHEMPSDSEDEKGLLLGDFVENELTILILQRPREGFASLMADSDPLSNVHLDTHTLIDYVIKRDPRFEEVNRVLQGLALDFELKVYENGLRQIIDASKKSGMSGKYGDVTLRTFVSCGRIMMTFEGKNGHQVTFLGAEDGDLRAGLQSIDATATEALDLVYKVIAVWEKLSPEERAQRHTDDVKVSML